MLHRGVCAERTSAFQERRSERYCGPAPVARGPTDALIERTAPDRILVMGASGHSRPHRMILGTVTEKVIDNASDPVLVSAKLLHAYSAPGRSD